MEADLAMTASFGSATAYLTWDIERLLAGLQGVIEEVDAGRLSDARRAFAGVERGFHRHLRIEEELVFPVFDARTGIVGGPTATLRLEHLELRRALGMMRDALDCRDAAGFHEGLGYLSATLPAHRSKEEHVLFPAMDVLLSGREREIFAERVQRE